MQRVGPLLIILFTLVGCADPAPEVISSDRLTTSVYATIASAQDAYCAVVFYRSGDITSPFYLEADSVVACNGVEATLSGNTYVAHFPPPNPSAAVKVTVVRPKAGSTTIGYYPLQ
ncbi:MAG: hypothetical protein ACXWRE_10840 [Pseudobdellovibrionaceae bacterium]